MIPDHGGSNQEWEKHLEPPLVTPEVGKPGFGKVSNRNTPQCSQGMGVLLDPGEGSLPIRGAGQGEQEGPTVGGSMPSHPG